MPRHRRKICVITASRADYGLLYWLMKEIKDDSSLTLQIVVTGMHLESRFGKTYRQIQKDGFNIDAFVDMKLESDTDIGIAKSCAREISGCAVALKRLKPDIVVILGDRFEMLPAAFCALLSGIPIAHIHGGELTKGSYDDSIRHAISKMAYLHLVAHRQYARRVIQMGEEPHRVFNVGACGLDNIKCLKLLPKKELEDELKIKLDKDVAVVTFHPVTCEKLKTKEYIKNLIKALQKTNLRVIFTMPNADAENGIIFKDIKKCVKAYPDKFNVFVSLGQRRYLSLMKEVGLMVGNSSSGILEAPSFRLPVVNIGTRQKGRIKAVNVIDADYDIDSISKAILKARSTSFKDSLNNLKNPFGNGMAGKKIKNILKYADLGYMGKTFYDLR